MKTADPIRRLWRAAGERYAHARRMFSEATDPNLIDAAIYEMNAAESWMSFAIAQARQEGIFIDSAPLISHGDRIVPEKNY